MIQGELLERITDTLDKAEGFRLFPYFDTKGKITIGRGHNLSDKGITPHIGEELFTLDLLDVERDLDRALPWWRSQTFGRQLALLELTFNMGIGKHGVSGLLSFTTSLPLWRSGQFDKVALNLLRSKWAADVGPVRAQRVAALIQAG